MSGAVEELKEHSRQILAAIQADATGETLSALMTIREERIQSLGAAIARGEAVGADAAGEIQTLEREIMDSLIWHRDAVHRELAALHHARWAGSAYRGESGGPCRYIDRAG